MIFAKQNLAWKVPAAGRSGFESHQWQQIFHFSKTPTLRPSQRLIRRVPGLFPGAKRPRRDSDHSFHLIPKVSISGAIPPLPCMPSWRWQGCTLPVFSVGRLRTVSNPHFRVLRWFSTGFGKPLACWHSNHINL